MSSKNLSPRLFRRILVDGNGGEVEVKGNRLKVGEHHVFVAQTHDGKRTGVSNTEVHTEDATALAACEQIVTRLQELGWRLKSQRIQAPTFALGDLPSATAPR